MTKVRLAVKRLDGPVKKPRVRFVDATEAGTHIGLVGIGGPQPPEDSAGQCAESLERPAPEGS